MIDAWTGATPKSTEYPKVENDGIRKLIDILRKQSTDLAEKTSNLFRTAGITITETLMTFGNNVRVEGTLTSTGTASFGGNTTVSGTLTTTGTANIDGAMDVDGSMSVGGTMNVTGDATFSGNLAVPNGSITNAALQNLTSGTAGNAAQSGITFSTGATAYSTAAFTVPAGFTSATVMATSAGFWGGGPGTAMQMYTRIAGADGAPMTSAIGSSGFANIASSYARSFPVAGGTSFSAQTIALYSGGGAPTGAITTSAVVFFYR